MGRETGMDSLFAVPETALTTFERIHGLRVTVHDVQGALWPFLLPDRFQHTQAACQAVKSLDASDACRAFDIARLRRELADQPEGRAHVCHAGLVEWVTPLFGASGLEGVLFAGVRLPGRGMTPYPRLLPVLADAPEDARPPTVDRDESDRIMEHLRQLAARLTLWKADAARELTGATPRPDHSGVLSDPVARRRTVIARFVHARRTGRPTIGELAGELGLSESRASHVVREIFGQSFRDLLTEARLQTAAGLLRHSSLPVLDIALRSGFDDPAHFHRLFRRRHGTTPARYRARSEP
jgi:AraC-like DNA-binding protein